MKKIISLMLTILMLCSFVGCGKDDSNDGGTNQNGTSVDYMDVEDVADSYTAVIKVKDMGEITLELDGKTAPITVANFVSLAKSGFYDGLTFHRIISGFMIQGGDPEGNGTGGSEKTIKGEFSLNGVENNIKHDRGVISMARSGSAYEQYLAYGYKLSDLPEEAKTDIERALNSASSQFFIMHQDTPSLDGSYAAFGRVTSGMDIVDKLATSTPVTDSNGTVLAENQPVIESITIK